VVQHIYSGFSQALATWLQDSTGHQVVVCDTDQSLAAGTVYLAPDTEHLAFKKPSLIGPRGGPPRGQQKPSIDELFLSAAEHLGAAAIAVLLTGMGRDGADGMASLKAAGALTIVQKPETCAVDSMPRAAIEGGSAKLILAPGDIPGALLSQHRNR
jgi:two-component system chemotaxis response regulator CheB